MVKFLLGVVVGILLFLIFLYLGGGKTVRKVGEDLIETGKKMEAMEETVKKGKGETGEIKKKLFKEEKPSHKEN